LIVPSICDVYNKTPYIRKDFCNSVCDGINTKEKCEARDIHSFYEKEIANLSVLEKGAVYAWRALMLPEELLSKPPKCQWNIKG
jgi:hypothetical protein